MKCKTVPTYSENMRCKEKVNEKLVCFPFARSGRPKRTGSDQFRRKSRGARVHFPATTLQIPALWPTGAGELSGSDP